MKKILEYLFAGNKLSKAEAKKVLLEIGGGAHSEAKFAALLTVFLMRNISSEELSGFREAMQELCLVTDLSSYNAIDIVGTGGDEKNTFNISTLSAFIVAGAGYNVTKHGNYAVSSTSGSSNVLEYLGYQFSNNKAKLENELEKANICFLHAPLFHPTMKHIAPVRKALKVKTFFNILGPMVNPSFPKFQLLGVYSLEVYNLYKEVYKSSDVNFAIVNSLDGYDEVSLTDGVRYATNHSETILNPGDFGFNKIQPDDLYGGENIKEAAKIFISILKGKGTTAQNNVVVANAGLAINCLLPKKKLSECVEIATESLKSGRPFLSFKNLIP
jgi:anthranilate phosphoribosyltransferase